MSIGCVVTSSRAENIMKSPTISENRFESGSWASLHYLKSHTVAYYLSRAAGADLSSTLNQGTVGTQPPGWTDAFHTYQIDPASVVPLVQVQTPVGEQRGTVTITATASDPDWGVSDVMLTSIFSVQKWECF